MGEVAWRSATTPEKRWPGALALAAIIVAQLALPSDLTIQPGWALPAVEAILLAALVAVSPTRVSGTKPARTLGLAICALATVANGASCVLLINDLVSGQVGQAGPMLLAGGTIWATNIVVFSLWYWELDRGGPAKRAAGTHPEPDFLFPQMTQIEPGHDPNWEPRYFDYLYVAFTSATAFSPTDTMPLTRWAKALMMCQQIISLATIVLIVARAISLLG